MSAPRWSSDARPGIHGHVLLPATRDALDPKATAVYLEVSAQYGDTGRVTVPSVADALGYSKSTVHERLWILRSHGLVSWTPGAKGTLRPCGLSMVAFIP